VFFQQQSVEKQLLALWDGLFLIAWWGATGKVHLRRRGASPVAQFSFANGII